jgi:hypothetical protein
MVSYCCSLLGSSWVEREREGFCVVALRAVEGGGGVELESGEFIDELLTERGGEGLSGTEEGWTYIHTYTKISLVVANMGGAPETKVSFASFWGGEVSDLESERCFFAASESDL